MKNPLDAISYPEYARSQVRCWVWPAYEAYGAYEVAEVHLHCFLRKRIRHDSSLSNYRKQKQSPPKLPLSKNFEFEIKWFQILPCKQLCFLFYLKILL
jgi:hypothetical protein